MLRPAISSIPMLFMFASAAPAADWPRAEAVAALPVLHCRQDMAIICPEGHAGCTSMDLSLHFFELSLSEMNARMMGGAAEPVTLTRSVLGDSGRAYLTLQFGGRTLDLSVYGLGKPHERVNFTLQGDDVEGLAGGVCARTPV